MTIQTKNKDGLKQNIKRRVIYSHVILNVKENYDRSFLLFIIGSVLLGISQANQQFYRYAAADNVSTNLKSKAISLVLAGCLIAIAGCLIALSGCLIALAGL